MENGKIIILLQPWNKRFLVFYQQKHQNQNTSRNTLLNTKSSYFTRGCDTYEIYFQVLTR
jgi:hypothetical protein